MFEEKEEYFMPSGCVYGCVMTCFGCEVGCYLLAKDVSSLVRMVA